MSIQFVCKCGKRLRGRTDAAAHGLICPSCGSLVDTPLEKPLVLPFGRAPFTPSAERFNGHKPADVGWEPNEPAAQAAAELVTRLRNERDDGFVELTAASARSRSAAPLAYRPSRFRQTWHSGTTWYHCLFFPRAARIRILLLGCLLGLFAAAMPFEVRRLLMLDESFGESRLIAGSAIGLATLLMLALVCVWFVCVLEAEKAGQLTVASLSLRQPGPALRSLALVICTFLGGPVFFAGLTLWFWVHTGRVLVIDRLIIGELTLVMSCYWLFSLAQVALSPWPRFANPVRVAELVHKLGFRFIILSMGAGGFAWLVLEFLIHAVKPIEHSAAVLVTLGQAVLCIACGSALLRLTGMWCRQTLKDQPSNSTPGSPVLTSPIK